MSRYAAEKPWRKSEIWKRDEGNRVLLKSSPFFGLKLNQTGSDIFECCNGKNSVEMIVDLLSSKYADVSREEIQDHVDTFLEELENMGFIVIKWDPF